MYRYMPMTAAHNWHTQGGEAKHERAAIESFCEWAEELDNRREKKIPLRKGRKSPSRLQGGGAKFLRGGGCQEKKQGPWVRASHFIFFSLSAG